MKNYIRKVGSFDSSFDSFKNTEGMPVVVKTVYSPGLVTPEGVHLSHKGKQMFAQGLARL